MVVKNLTYSEGTDRVCETTQRRADEASLTIQLLQALPDIDCPEDLSLLPTHIWAP
jgi:glycosyltransferase A (GT-A) superfamily protein (DUF2064 family)